MNVFADPNGQAVYLIRICGGKSKALDHAIWAFGHVQKIKTKDFWGKVIDALTNM